jgi:hypothetical protein
VATIDQIREGLRAALDTIADWQVSAYMLASPTPPAMHIFPEEIDYDGAMHRGMDTLMFTVEAFAGISSDIGAQKKLDQMLAPSGATSVKAAVEADRTLGGIVSDLHITKATGYRVYELHGAARAPVLGCQWSVEIIS